MQARCFAVFGQRDLQVDDFIFPRTGWNQCRGNEHERSCSRRAIQKLLDVERLVPLCLLETVFEHCPPAAGRRAAAGTGQLIHEAHPTDGERLGVAHRCLGTNCDDSFRIGRVFANLGSWLKFLKRVGALAADHPGDAERGRQSQEIATAHLRRECLRPVHAFVLERWRDWLSDSPEPGHPPRTQSLD